MAHVATQTTKRVKQLKVAEMERSGTRLIYPEGWTHDDVIDQVQRLKERDEQEVVVQDKFAAMPWDGALALQQALEEKYGYSTIAAVPGFFGDSPPASIAIEVAPGETIQVPWGRFPLPAGAGHVDVGAVAEGGNYIFMLNASTRRKYETDVRELFGRVRRLLAENSIYRGKALKLRWDEKKNPFAGTTIIPVVQPLHLDNASDSLVFPRELEDAIDRYVYGPIMFPEACREDGMPGKRGVLLAGPYGTGKTLLTQKLARIATASGWTVVYIEDTANLPAALNFARQYGKAVVIGEDIDRRADTMNDQLVSIRNTLDSIEAKGYDVMVVVTTNFLEKIHGSMLRPGRFDIVLNVQPPDAEASERLLRVYASDRLAAGEDITAVAAMLSGSIPAVIHEVVKRAKYSAIWRTKGADSRHIVAADLESAAYTVLEQQKLVNGGVKELPTPEEQAGQALKTLFKVGAQEYEAGTV